MTEIINQKNEQTFITAKVIDEENGIKEISNINAIRVKSKDYRILIMADFAPLLGMITSGEVSFLSSDGDVTYKDIDAYYKHQRNEFTLIIKKDFDGWYKKV